MNFTDILTLLGGVGMFLFGIRTMGDGLENVAGSKMKDLLKVLTRNRFLAVTVGFAVTAIIQSSSATTVMVVGFVNAGLMSLAQAVGVIMGANIGTTVTSVLVAINFSSIAPVTVFIGVALSLFTKKNVTKNIGHILIGFGLLFVGLSTMSGAMSALKTYEPFTDFITAAAGSPFTGVLIGLVMTAIIQSSSASVGILQALAIQGLVPIEFAVFVLFGQNIGTVVTTLIATVGTRTNSKRAAVMHLLFNVIGTAIFVLITVFTPYVGLLKSITDDTVAQIAIAHIIFNLVSTVVMFPFANLLVKISCKLVPEKKGGAESKQRFEFIDERFLGTPPFAVVQAGREVSRMARVARDNFCTSARALINRDISDIVQVFENEEVINYLNHNITGFLIKINSLEISEKDSRFIGALFHVINDIERIGDHAVNLAEAAQKSKNDGLTVSAEAAEELKNLFNEVITLLDRAIFAFDSGELSDAEGEELSELEENIDDLALACQDAHIFRLNRKECNTESGMLFMNTITDFERVGDHAINIAFLTKEAKGEEVKKM